MPVRPPAPCRRGPLSRPAPVSQTGVWVTDCMLLQAIEKYQRRSPAQYRGVRSYAGPLESRRRLGKRHMAGIMPIARTSLPTWRFDIAPDLGSWHWEPPTTSSYRKSLRESPVPGKLFNRLLDWLEDSGPNKPFIQSPGDVETADAVLEQLPIANPQSSPQDLDTTTIGIPRELVRLRSKICLLEEVDTITLLPIIRPYCRSMRRRIERGDLCIQGLEHALEPLDAKTRERIADPQIADAIVARIHESLFSSLAAAQDRNPESIPDGFWSALAAKAKVSESGAHSTRIAWQMIDVMPCSCLSQLSFDQISDMVLSFVLLQRNRRRISSIWLARADKLGEAIQSLETYERGELYNRLTALVAEESNDAAQSWNSEFSRLLIMAHDAQIETEQFTRTLRRAVGDTSRLNSLQLWQILVARLRSTKVVDQETVESLNQTEYLYTSQRWTSLVEAVLRSGQPDPVLQQICGLLVGVGRFEVLTQALAATQNGGIDTRALQAVARASNDHRMALNLYDAVGARGGRKGALDCWQWTTWSMYVEAMIKDPKMDPSRVWQVLNLRATPANGTEEDTRAKMELLDKMGEWYLEAGHLSDRQALRGVERCVSNYRWLTKGISSRSLVSVTKAVTRDLEKGQWGRNTRMEWLLKLVAEHQGVSSAKGVSAALEGWRAMIQQAGSRRG